MTSRMKDLLLVLTLTLALGHCSHVDAKTHRSREVTREFQRLHPCPSTGKRTGACPGYIKDHVKPLACGGPDSVSNLQWQTKRAAKEKDKWERKSCSK